MISTSYSIPEFVDAIADKSYRDILTMAVQEATEVERQIYKSNSKNDTSKIGEKAYADSLKRFILYLRCTVKPTKSKDPNFPFFEMISKNLERRQEVRCMNH